MNQRYRNDQDYRRRDHDDDSDRRYAQPHPDSRFNRDWHEPRQASQQRSRDNNDYDRSQGSQSREDQSSAWSSRRGNDANWREHSREFGGRSEQRWQPDQDHYSGRREARDFDDRFEEPFGARLLSRDNEFSGTAGGYGSSRDFARQGNISFGGRGSGGAGSFEGYGSGHVAGRYYGGQTLESAGGIAPSWGSRNQRGEHFGKGPKGYRRSDERIREDVCDRLAQDDELDASEIIVTTTNGEVTLEGAVPDRYSKHRAEDIVDSISGVVDIHNRLKVNKGFLEELGDKVMGRENNHSGNAGSRPIENKNGLSAGTR